MGYVSDKVHFTRCFIKLVHKPPGGGALPLAGLHHMTVNIDALFCIELSPNARFLQLYTQWPPTFAFFDQNFPALRFDVSVGLDLMFPPSLCQTNHTEHKGQHTGDILACPYNIHKIALTSLPTENLTDCSIVGHLNIRLPIIRLFHKTCTPVRLRLPVTQKITQSVKTLLVSHAKTFEMTKQT